MRQALLLFIFIIICSSARAQTVPGSALIAPVASPTATPDAAKPVAVPENSELKTGEKSEKAVKTAVTVSPRFRATLPAEKLRPMIVPRSEIESAPTIDGKLDDAIWQTAAQFKDFFQTSPGDHIAPSKQTIAYLAYDAENFYIAFHCFDEPDKIRATVAKRDAIFSEDNVRVYLDTYDDQRRAYVLGFNPLGIQLDAIYTEGQGMDTSVDIVMESKGAIVADGWVVEARVPFKSLRYTAGKNKNWGVHFVRNIDRFNDELDSWMPQDPNVTGLLIQEGKITGLENIKVERTLELVPSVTFSQTSRRKATFPSSAGRFVDEGVRMEPSLNLKFNITPNITLDAALNPDFAEVEADALVVTTNQRFPIFFQEKRPFFLEGVEIFQSPLRPFYSRQIVDPDVATKLTGKIDKTSFGFLIASDNAPGNYGEDELVNPFSRARANEFLDKNAQFAVVRLKQDFGKENNIGFFGTARTFPEQRNFVAGFDGRVKWNPRLVSQFQILGTHTRRCLLDQDFEVLLSPAEAARNREICSTGAQANGGNPNVRYRTGNGVGYFFNADYTERDRGWYFETSGRSKDYRADAGFTRRVNTNNVLLAGRLSTAPAPKNKIVRFSWRPNASMNYNWQARSTDINLGSNFNVDLQRNTYLFLETGAYYERIFEGEFGGLRRGQTRAGEFFGAPERSAWQHYISGGIESAPTQRISFNAFVGRVANAFDFDFGGGSRFPRVSPAAIVGSGRIDPGVGTQFDLSLGAEYKPIDPFRISLQYSKSNLQRSDTALTAFDSNIFTLRSTYQFTRFAFLRARWDFDSISSNARGQILLGYNPSPGTAIYAGYNDNFNYNGFNPFTGDGEPRFERNGRTFFIRASYLFRRSF